MVRETKRHIQRRKIRCCTICANDVSVLESGTTLITELRAMERTRDEPADKIWLPQVRVTSRDIDLNELRHALREIANSLDELIEASEGQ